MSAYHSAKTHCPRGHEYAGTNLRVRNGRRECRRCAADRSTARRQSREHECISPVCVRPAFVRGLCSGHYSRVLRNGDARLNEPLGSIRRPAFDEAQYAARFWSHVVKGDGCWTWIGTHSHEGYGQVTQPRYAVSAHRTAYILTYGPVPPGQVLDHFVCSNPGCCNPAHVRPVTHRENALRSEISVAARMLAKTHCIRGHAFTPENTRVDRGGGRHCRACARAHARATTEKAKAARQAVRSSS